MADNANELLARINNSFDHLTVEDAKAWISKNPKDQLAAQVLYALESNSPDVELIIWASNWVRSYPNILDELIKIPPKSYRDVPVSHIALLAREQEINDSLGIDSGEEINNLLRQKISKSILNLAYKWLSTYPSANYSDFVILALLEISPSKEHVDLALDWLSSNESNITAWLIMAELVKLGHTKDIKAMILQAFQAKDIENQRKIKADAIFKLTLAGAVIKYCKDKTLYKISKGYCIKALNSESSKYYLPSMEGYQPNDDIAELIIDWIFRNSQTEHIDIHWAPLLIIDSSPMIINRCWQWLCLNFENKYYDSIFKLLLDISAENSKHLPAQAIEQAWKLFDSGRLDYASSLVRLDKRPETKELIFSKTKSGLFPDELTCSVLISMLEANPTEEIIAFAEEKVKNHPDGQAEFLGLIRVLLQIKPTADVINKADKILNNKNEARDHKYILELLIGATKDHRYTKRAIELISIESTLGFRRDVGFEIGRLLISLLKSNCRYPHVETHVKCWLEFYSYRASEDTKEMKALLS